MPNASHQRLRQAQLAEVRLHAIVIRRFQSSLSTVAPTLKVSFTGNPVNSLLAAVT